MIESIGWIGGILLAWCGLPLAISAFKNKRDDTNRPFLFIWLIGEILTLMYVLFQHGLDIPLTINYGSNIIIIVTVLYYNFKGKKDVI